MTMHQAYANARQHQQALHNASQAEHEQALTEYLASLDLLLIANESQRAIDMQRAQSVINQQIQSYVTERAGGQV